MTDVNSSEFQSASSRFSEENNSSFILNQSNVPMDIDLDDEIISSNATKINGYRSPSIENGNKNIDDQDKEDIFHLGNPVLNKSFDVLPQIKDDDTPSADPISDSSVSDILPFTTNTNVLDTTVELPNNSDEFDSQDLNDRQTVHSEAFLSNQFSLEYPYVIPQPVENTQPSPPLPTNPIETVTTLTKNMKLNVNKTLEGQEPSTPTSATDKSFDTNTFVLKKKERRKVTTPATEPNFNATSEMTPSDLSSKQSPFNTPSTSVDIAAASRPATSQQQQPLTDPTRIM